MASNNVFGEDDIFNLCDMADPILKVQTLGHGNDDHGKDEPAAAQKQHPSHHEKDVAQQQPSRRDDNPRRIIIRRDATGHASPLEDVQDNEEETHPAGSEEAKTIKAEDAVAVAGAAKEVEAASTRQSIYQYKYILSRISKRLSSRPKF
ncbi:hypothetical protein PUN28_020898 [Cardiocondyla obscurior]|uniref:Uncharacterized protein n=1 Tax=Cardiocondyla obscurior TaxID=286306 RepID=A0AAW2E9P0_9HYME